ncbi:hypothetical protein BaRGS_00033326 [Batillaria attramentaria]|uniref:Uncharacterized protein n=1 Tax=Batillaria attramentaria TaxID=370345 RepID=A0ABD0JKH0_9CAEN
MSYPESPLSSTLERTLLEEQIAYFEEKNAKRMQATTDKLRNTFPRPGISPSCYKLSYVIREQLNQPSPNARTAPAQAAGYFSQCRSHGQTQVDQVGITALPPAVD